MIGRTPPRTSAGTEPAGDDRGHGGTETTEATGTPRPRTPPRPEARPRALPGAEDVGKVGGSGCGIPHGPYEEDGEAPAGEVRVAWNQAPYSFNSNTNRGNATANTNPRYLMGSAGRVQLLRRRT